MSRTIKLYSEHTEEEIENMNMKERKQSAANELRQLLLMLKSGIISNGDQLIYDTSEETKK